MKRCVLYLLLSVLLAAAAGPAAGQELINVRVSAEPPGARFIVDGQTYTAATTFLWPKGSKHVVTVMTPNFGNLVPGVLCGIRDTPEGTQYDESCRVRYSFGGWETNAGSLGSSTLLTQSFTADPGLTFIRAKFSVEYKIDVALVEGPVPGPSPACAAKASRPLEAGRTGEGVGVVYVGGACFDYSGSLWLAAGEIQLQAIPFDGYAFAGWYLDGAPPRGSITTYTVRGPAVLNPRFVNAKRVQIVTDPVGLKVRVDRAEIKTVNLAEWVNAVPIPGRFDWLPGSQHVLGGVSPQTDQSQTGKMWVFHSWSNGGGQDMVYTADHEVSRLTTLTAKFVPGVQVNFMTEPKGLRLNIDGRENWPVYGFVWGLGSKYTVSAPAEQLDARGRRWTFKGWKHGGPATQEIVIDEQAIASGGLYYTAVFESVPQVTLQSSLPGLKMQVDGAECSVPCRLDKPMGTLIRVSVPEVIPVSEVSRWEFAGWHDGAGAERVITVDRETLAFQANYRQTHRLIAVLDPEEGGAIRAEPASLDGFYPEGQNVTVTVEPKPGFKFRRWDGDLAGTVKSGVVAMSMPRAVRAALDRVPYLPPASVKNAAGPTPVEGVAPGSLISIGGASLTTVFESGPASPLAQTLGGVVVLVGDRILPLIYVSPDQINALLPSDLEPGTHRLVVRPQSGPQVSTEFQVVRNAPGLFSNLVDSKGYAVALREDGSAITPQNRARRDEVITILGTGFGPYDRPVVDGFAVPASPVYSLIDPVELVVGSGAARPLWAGAHAGMTGVAAVRFRVPADAAGEVEVRLKIAGAESNTVLLPVE